MTEREQWMTAALALAEEALEAGEVPVGCVIVRNGTVIGRGRNRREERRSALAHAEVEAIRQACAACGDWRLSDCDLYVTLEPCAMCAGAILNARLRRVFYGAPEPNTGACGSVLNLFEENFGYRPAVYAGVLGEACGDCLRRFFRDLRDGARGE